MCMHVNCFAVHLKPTQHCKSTALQLKKKNHSKPCMVKRRAFSIQHCKGKRKRMTTRNQTPTLLPDEVLSILKGTRTPRAPHVGDLQHSLGSSFKTQTVSSPEQNALSKANLLLRP